MDVRRAMGRASAVLASLPWREVARSSIGLACWSAVVAGVWGLGGWEWGLIAAGLPGAIFYAWGEARAVAPPREG